MFFKLTLLVLFIQYINGLVINIGNAPLYCSNAYSLDIHCFKPNNNVSCTSYTGSAAKQDAHSSVGRYNIYNLGCYGSPVTYNIYKNDYNAVFCDTTRPTIKVTNAVGTVRVFNIDFKAERGTKTFKCKGVNANTAANVEPSAIIHITKSK